MEPQGPGCRGSQALGAALLDQQGQRWNRACIVPEDSQLEVGDRHLAALLLVHGVISNGGVLHAFEVVSAQELQHATMGYRFFGFDDVATFETRARVDTTREDELDELEAELDRVYRSLVPSDGHLSAGFELVYRSKPDAFAPVSA